MVPPMFYFILSYLLGKFRRCDQSFDRPTTLSSQASLTHEARLTNDRERVAMPVWKRGSNRRRSYTHVGPTTAQVAKLARPSKWSFVRLSAAAASPSSLAPHYYFHARCADVRPSYASVLEGAMEMGSPQLEKGVRNRGRRCGKGGCAI